VSRITLDEARAAKRTALRLLDAVDNVVGVGITRSGGEYAVKINLSGPVGPGVELPTDIDGVPVRVEITGPLRAR
jgi:hypothetical protein